MPAGHYVTPTSQINLMQSKKPSNLPMGAGSLNLGSRMNNAQQNAAGGNADDIMAQNASSNSGGGNGGMGV